MIVGLYLVLWGKEGDDADPIKSKEPSSMSSQEPKEASKDDRNGDNLKKSQEV